MNDVSTNHRIIIPKVIHYCWFGGKPLPNLAIKCIESWKKYFPDWEIKQWDERNFDVNSIPYTAEAYKAGKYAFVSDFARFKILYDFGGVYFDTDVEVIAPMTDIIARGNFLGCEKVHNTTPGCPDVFVAPGLGMGASARLPFYKKILDFYTTLHFKKPDGSINNETVVVYTTNMLCKSGLREAASIQYIEDIHIYPTDYFCPIDFDTLKCDITPNTRSIHHYTSSWMSNQDKRKFQLKRKLNFLPDKLAWKLAHLLTILRQCINPNDLNQ